MKRNKITFIGSICLVMVLAAAILAGCGGPAPTETVTQTQTQQPTQTQPQEYEARLAAAYKPGMVSYDTMGEFKRLTEEATDGMIKVQLYRDGELYDQVPGVMACASGAVKFWSGPSSAMAHYDENFNMDTLPFLVTSMEEHRYVWEESDAGQALWQHVEEDMGLIKMANGMLYTAGIFVEPRANDSLEAYEGLKLRAYGAPMRAVLQALGAEAIVIPTAEVTTALQQGMVDGLVTSYEGLLNRGWWEFITYVPSTPLRWSNHWMMINADWFSELPADVQDTMENEVFPATDEYAIAQSTVAWENMLSDLEEKGCTVFDTTPENQAEIEAVALEAAEEMIADNEIAQALYAAAQEN